MAILLEANFKRETLHLPLSPRYLSLLTALLLLVTACSEPATPVQATPKTPTSAPAQITSTLTPTAAATAPVPEPAATSTPRPAPTSQPFPPELQRQAEQILRQVEQARGSPARGEIDMRIVTRNETIRIYREELDDEADDLRKVTELYQLLGLIPRNTDFATLFLSFLGGGIVGFYDPDYKTLYLLEDQGLSGSTVRSTVAHELAHALQDQYYGLEARSEAVEDDWDASRAFTSLVEGDAVYTEQLAFGSAVHPSPGCFTIPRAASGLPYVIIREINSWYEDGACFVAAALQQQAGGIDALYQRAPSTTEQVLHPDKYLAGEGPLELTLKPVDATLGAEWQLSESSTMGEFWLQNLLMLGLSSDRARVQEAAAGWGAGKWQFFAGPAQSRLFYGVTRWDSEEDARQFFTGLTASVRGRGGSGTTGESSLSWSIDGVTWRAARDSDSVTFIVSNNPGELDRVASVLSLP